MSFLTKISRSNFFIKLLHWEYWPFGIIHFPAIIYYCWLSLRSKSFLFFSASNPGIPMGGMFGESKFEILRKFPPDLIPKTILVEIPVALPTVKMSLQENQFSMPVIFKPDLG